MGARALVFLLVVATGTSCTRGSSPSPTASPSARGTIVGLVVEAARTDVVGMGVFRRPLSGEEVTIRDASNKVVGLITTSSDGRFRVTLSPGRYTLVFVRQRADHTKGRDEAVVDVVAGETVGVRLVDHLCRCG